MTLDFPACPTHEETPPPEMLSALGISRYVEARKGRAWLIVLENRQQVEALAPRFSAMTPGEHKVSVTARGEGEYDFVSRFFSPGVSVPEDRSPAPRTPCCSLTGAKSWAKPRCLPVRFQRAAAM